tara:strand:+ start:196 stop:375 length:180 start_codon:yes stop_codon:yes gene_type:complete
MDFKKLSYEEIIELNIKMARKNTMLYIENKQLKKNNKSLKMEIVALLKEFNNRVMGLVV